MKINKSLMTKFFNFIFLTGFLLGCKDVVNDSNHNSLKEYIHQNQKNIRFKKVGECSPELSNRSFNKIEITDSLVKQSVIKLIFNFVSNCCFEFLPGYTVVDNVLSINLEEMNEIGCGCLCCRRYDLQIVDIDAPFSTYKIYIKNKGK
jgi:hypothetical protein